MRDPPHCFLSKKKEDDMRKEVWKKSEHWARGSQATKVFSHTLSLLFHPPTHTHIMGAAGADTLTLTAALLLGKGSILLVHGGLGKSWADPVGRLKQKGKM